MELRETRDGLGARAEFDGGSASLHLEERAGDWRATVSLTATAPTAIERLLRWADSTALSIAGTQVLACIDNPPADLVTLLKSAGYSLAVAEDEMRRPCSGAAPPSLPAGLAFVPWEEASAPLFHHAYFESFRERPGFPGWDEARWRASVAAGPEFRPDLSRVVLDGPEPAAFAVLSLEDGLGWVVQVGVRPGWRGKGLGEALLNHALRAFAKEGVETLALQVATNNPTARALYERMGFELTSTHISWRKQLA